MAGIERLKAADLDFHTISVLTSASLREPDRMFDFFVENLICDVGFNVEEIEGVHTHSDLTLPGFDEVYRDFLTTFLHRNRSAGFPLRVREAEFVAEAIQSDGIAFNAQVRPGDIIAVDVAGNVSTFSPELLGQRNQQFHDFIIGNIWQTGIPEMLDSDLVRLITSEISLGTENCRNSCDLFRFCRGGCPVNKISETGSFRVAETMHCRFAVKTVVRACVDHLLTAATGPLSEVVVQ